MIKNFKNLEIWKRSRKLVRDIYLLTDLLPEHEKFGLVSQMRRAAISVPSNIAEGCGRRHEKDLIRFLGISIASLCELETQLYLVIDLDFVDESSMTNELNEIVEIRKMISGFIKSIER
ncbi:MAG: four helix bundle protein [Bacteroidota bacterium]